jgi:tRNA (guanine37-N1)-methyltransferase
MEIEFAVRVELKGAEKLRKFLFQRNLIRNDLKIKKEGRYVYFPLKEFPLKVPKDLTYKLMKKEFEKKKPKSYKEIVPIPEELRNLLPTSYDIIGDIALIKIPHGLLRFRKEIGESLLKCNKNIKAVYQIEPISGELRTRNVKILAGERRTVTTHNEYGLRYKVDIKDTYFSPRLATERKRIASLIKDNERVLDMFAGVAPFSIMIAKYSSPFIVYAVDKNEKAVELAKQNIRLNKVLDKVEVIHCDAQNIHNILREKVDRIIMNLPFSSYLFFEQALKVSRDHCTIHYYEILKEAEIEERINTLRKKAEREGFFIKDLDIKKIKTYAPREFYICISITVMPM